MADEFSGLMTVDQAMSVIDALPVTPRKMRLAMSDALGYRLAEEVSADRDYPPVDKALMDGYAVRSADVAHTPVELEVVGESAAGRGAAGAVGPGQAMTIMTGAPLPAGADGVVPIEQTGFKAFANAGERVRILKPAAPGACIAARGSDIHGGQIVLRPGMLLSAPQIAVAACVGAQSLAVWDRPRCAVLATGNELIAPDQTPAEAQLRDSNTPMLLGLLNRLGYAATGLGRTGDSIEQITAAIREALKFDAIFLTGGMSAGRHDHVPRVLKDLGAELKITQLRIRPGKPFILAVMPGGQYVFGLPGNPVSAFVCTLRLASRLLARMAGGKPLGQTETAELAGEAAANGAREFYQPAVWEGRRVKPLAWKGSADIFTLAMADVLIVRPAAAPAALAGASVPIIRIP
jgi:molybdopterin molybdotransferase